MGFEWELAQEVSHLLLNHHEKAGWVIGRFRQTQYACAKKEKYLLVSKGISKAVMFNLL